MIEKDWNYLISIEADKVLNDFDKKRIEMLAKDSDQEIRSKVSETLGLFSSDFNDEILLNMLNDDDELVRVNACDSLSLSKNPIVINYLLNMLEDESELVRTYAVLSIADVALKVNIDILKLKKALSNKLKKEQELLSVSIYRALYLFGKQRTLKRIVNYISSEDYSVQIFTIRTLGELRNISNSKIINSVLAKKSSQQNPVSVKYALDDVMEERK